jgi:hypothetical protein
MNSSQSDWTGDAALHALGRLPEDEAADLEDASRESAELQEELAELRQTAAMLGVGDVGSVGAAPTPPRDLPERIIAAVADTRRQRGRTVRRRIAAVAVGAAAATVVVIALVAMLADDRSQPEFAVFEITADQVDGRYALEGNAVGTSITLEFEGLDQETLYWLWLTDAYGQRSSAGTFVGDGGGGSVVMLQSGLPLESAARIWVTDEVDDVVLDSELEDGT